MSADIHSQKILIQRIFQILPHLEIKEALKLTEKTIISYLQKTLKVKLKMKNF